MTETYTKIDEDTLEETTIHTKKIKKADLEMERVIFEEEIKRAEKSIAEINEKLYKLE